MQRVARCSCGNLQTAVSGDPDTVVACHCIACQRRTGSVLGVSAYWPQNRVRRSGHYKTWVRTADSGKEFIMHFCPSCGASLYWIAGNKPGMVGIAVGAFGDPSFPSPIRSVWEQTMHPWVLVGVAQGHFLRSSSRRPEGCPSAV